MKTSDLREFWDAFGPVIIVFGPTLVFYLFLAWVAVTKTPNETHVSKSHNATDRHVTSCATIRVNVENGRIVEGRQ
jgi:hypothetical protein|nr:MAG TPA: hypothetical protein [Caudoviricetes sp.]